MLYIGRTIGIATILIGLNMFIVHQPSAGANHEPL
jgi:hypothetical protein